MNYSQVTVDILQNPKYAGAIESVRGVTNWIDSGFGIVITMVAFLIILVAMLKNVLAAAYCAYPKFWEKVDTAHKERDGQSWLQRFNPKGATNMSNESFSMAILGMLPNIKSYTDFEGDTVSPKQYFIRAIPQMLVCIIIGAFIYNGYYRDTAAKVVDFGSEMVQRVLVEVDPIAVFDQFTGSTGRPTFASDGSEIPMEQLVNKLATNVYGAVIGEYNDVKSADAKRALANIVEGKMRSWVETLQSTDPSYVDGVSWKPIMQVSITNGMVDISKIDGVSNKDGTVMQYALQFPVSDLNLSSNINVGVDMYVRVRVNFEKQAVATGKHAVSDLTLHVSPSASQSALVTCVKGSNLLLNSTAGAGVTGTQMDAQGNKVEAIFSVSEDSDKNRVMSVTLKGGSTSGVYTLSTPIKVSDSANNTTHYITAISFESGDAGTMSSTAENRTGITWSTEDLGVVGWDNKVE